jgi:hypothetical protein
MRLKIPLSISVLVNIILITGIIFRHYDLRHAQDLMESGVSKKNRDLYIKSYDNFDSVFFKRNDSLYRELWNEAMQDDPEQAFLMACSYFYLTKDNKIKFTVDNAYDQLKIIYHK